MRSKRWDLLHWALFIVVLFSAISGSKGSASQSLKLLPPEFEAAPPSIKQVVPSVSPSAAPHASKEHKYVSVPSVTGIAPASITSPADHSYAKGISPSVTPVPPEVKGTSNITRSPLIAPSHSPPVVKGTAPPATHSANNFNFHSPTISPALSTSPTNRSSIKGSSPAITPAPPQVEETSNITKAPIISPTMSTVPHDAMQPSHITDAPFPSHPSSPVTNSVPNLHAPTLSPRPHEVNEPKITMFSPFPSQPHPSPGISPTPHKENNSSSTAHTPFASGLSTLISRPTPHEDKGPSNITHPPLPSNPLPVDFSPGKSPTPQEAEDPSNSTYSPLPSLPLPSESSPAKSPAARDMTSPSNITHAPAISPKPHDLPLKSSPMISPTPHEAKDHLNITHAPLASDPKPSRISPTISPTSHEVKEPLSPLPSHAEFSPMISPTSHQANNHSNITHALIASDHKPSILSPTISPTPHEGKDFSSSSPVESPTLHEVKDPSNATISPLPSHALPSPLSPMVSPSNVTHSPLPSHPNPLHDSPAVSPVPHEKLKDPSIAPLASHPRLSGSAPMLGPMPHEVKNFSNIAHAPMSSRPNPPPNITHAPLSPLPPSSHHPDTMISPAPSHIPAVSPNNKPRQHAPSPYMQGHSVSPLQSPSNPPRIVPKNNKGNVEAPSHSPNQAPFPSTNKGGAHAPSLSPNQAPFPSTNKEGAHAPSPSSVIPLGNNRWPIHAPILPPESLTKPMTLPPEPVWALPPPPPNLDCKPLSCQDNVTYPPPGSICVCVLPIKVGLHVSIALYTFFPLVSELAQEIASGIFMKQSQVRIMGANSASEDPEKTIVMIDLVPVGRSFDINTALLIFTRFWNKQVPIKASYFGDYDVLYVSYPGLPPSPPMAPGDINIDGGAFTNGRNARKIKPIGVDVRSRKKKLSNSLIAIIVPSSVVALVISIGAAWILLLKRRSHSRQPPPEPQQSPRPVGKFSGAPTLGSGPSLTSASFTSSIPAHAGSAKTFSLSEMEKATDRFHDSRLIGEGGFGRVYQGTLEDGTMVAVKVLKRDDHQGGRGFFAEVEMLSRLHHRNLVKLIGICTEKNVRCLIYELVPNGSVESHLHGVDKESSPLDWNARMKIALGAARGLSYLHEDSSPRVIHRDFKSSNILLEHDFTPKVSDFGLARAALDEGNDHISTCVMGTFGYVAPEYAMTGHLLVKSDVYSYGVVLLELLTGRKPIDMSQPPGQENLVGWARPLLTSTDRLEKLIDPSLPSTTISMDSMAKVAAIASMCVQPEVTHRPFMSEVVQALKLVCNENNSDEHRTSFSQDESSTKDLDVRISTGSGLLEGVGVLSESDMYCNYTATFGRDASGSFQRYYGSGPLKIGRSQKLWERVRGFSSGNLMLK